MDGLLTPHVEQYLPGRKRSDGIFNRWERADIMSSLIQDVEVEDPEYTQSVLEVIDQLEHQIVRVPAVDRLNHIMMLDKAPVNKDQKPTVHNRFQHSELLSHLAMTIGLRLKLPKEQILAMALAGWLHDTGHTAFAHAGEDAINAIYEPENKFDHEEASHGHANSDEIQRICGDLNIDSNLTHDIIDEKDVCGALQSVCDTLSYLLLDVQETGRGHLFTNDDAVRLIKSVVAVKNVKGEQILEVSETEPLQKLLEIREHMYEEVYYSFSARVTDIAIGLFLAQAKKQDVVKKEDLIDMTDRELVLRLHSFVYGPPSLQNPVLSDCAPLFDLAMGTYPNPQWKETEYNTEDEAHIHITNNKFFIVEPKVVHPRKKTIKLLVSGQEEPIALSTDNTKTEQPAETKWILLEPIEK